MAKDPVMGRVKTRLAREVGAAEAVRFYRATAAAVIGRLARDPRFETVLAVAPDRRMASRGLPAGLRRRAQGGGDLGQRMQRLLADNPPGPVVIIGTDIPGIRARHIVDAFRCLGRHDAVFGPAGDGGFWLVGLRRFPRLPPCFAGVRWSSPDTLADCLANFDGHPVAFAAQLSDCDNASDLGRLASLIGRRILPEAANAH